MKLSPTIAFLILLAQVTALPFLHLPRSSRDNNVLAEIDPRKAPKTAQNIRNHVAIYGAHTMTVKVRDLNNDILTDILRKEATGGKQLQGLTIGEEPPASFRKRGNAVSIMATDIDESRHQGGVLSRAIRVAKKMGPEATITQGIKGENLMAYERRPADVAKARHRTGKNHKRRAIWLEYLKEHL